MNFQENVEFELPVVISRAFVLLPNEITVLSMEREFSRNAILVSKDRFETYCVLVSQLMPDNDQIEGYDDVYHVATIAKVTDMRVLNKSVKVSLLGVKRVNLNELEFREDKYFYGKCTLKPEVKGDDKEEIVLVSNLISEIEKSNPSHILIPSVNNIADDLSKGLNALDLSYAIGSKLNVSVPAKQQLLECETINDRLMKLILDVKELEEIAGLDRKIKRSVQESSEKQQKEYFLREQIRAIKKELGEDTNNSSEKILDKINKYPYPEEVKEKIKDEVRRKEMMPQGSLESSLIQDYIDIVLNVPWFQNSQDNDDINHAKQVLDEDHYGLKKVKERIIEYLAVKKVKGNLKAPILCFYGPPGCGKTSLSYSIARALDREFIKCSLGGVSDEGEIRGHRRTYVGSRPGRIINQLRKSGVRNPVFLLDEIDKLSHDSFKGDPASALLEVLDPEQNTKFADNYLELNYDLSDVLFICTANNVYNIPGPLRDRLELINVPSYTVIDKLHIAKDYLIKRETKANGLDENSIKFDDDAILYIIDRYTRESGVRELQRLIGSCIRKVIVKEVVDKDTKNISYTVTVHDVKEFLGIEIFESTKKEKGAQIGVMTGLAYTDFGGDILPIEVNYFKGKGTFMLTGQLGDVMKESCQIALDYVKANCEKYGIDPEIFEKNDIHIHVPEGAVPKDGPSAGVAITIAIISALSHKEISGDIAMTGEVTLRGKVIGIGGLREKSLAAMRSGIKEIIVPFDNKRNITELPEEVTKKLKIRYMKTVDDAYKYIFE